MTGHRHIDKRPHELPDRLLKSGSRLGIRVEHLACCRGVSRGSRLASALRGRRILPIRVSVSSGGWRRLAPRPDLRRLPASPCRGDRESSGAHSTESAVTVKRGDFRNSQKLQAEQPLLPPATA